MSKSLGEYILDRTESLEDNLIEEYFVKRNDDKIDRLRDSEQYLLEGSRGIGKTMLLKTAEIKCKASFERDSVLAVWVNFEESLRIERINVIDSSIDPFMQWTMGKILNETLKTVITLKPDCIDELNDRLSSIFNFSKQTNYDKYQDVLETYLRILEKGDVEDNSELSESAPSKELAEILDNPKSFKEFLLNLIEDFKLNRIVFLFDEAAHVFSHNQQEKFFTFFKSLRNPRIGCKAAVYPGITNYGKYFDKGQDAKELRIGWSPSNPEDVKYIKEILKKRIQSFDPKYWEKLTTDPNIIDMICISSNGNPRFAFHIIDELESSKAFSSSKVQNTKLINALRAVFVSKWKEFETLKQRLLRYTNYISKAEELIKNTILPNLRSWNERRYDSDKKLSSGFYVSVSVYEKIPQVFETLAYANIIVIDYSKKSIGHGNYGYFMAINPSLLFADLIIKEANDFKKVSVAIENNQAYYETTQEIKELISELKIETEYTCSNSQCDFKTNDSSFSFCPKCGNKINASEAESLYKLLRAHDISNLKLSPFLVSKAKEKFDNIGEVYDADLDDIRTRYVQDVRINLIKNAAIEYMAG